jgi:hypothetical protein
MKIPWGAFDLETGKWHYSKVLASISKFSEEKQRESNIKDGYLCKCGYMPTRCKCGSKNMPMIYKVSNEELQIAIDKTFAMSRHYSHSVAELELLQCHLKELLEVQIFRAKSMERPKE